MKRLIHFPKTTLSELVDDFGGMNRDDAIRGAQRELESMCTQADQAIDAGIAALQRISAAPDGDGGHSPAQLHEILVHGDQIVTLAGMFGHWALDGAARCLCDLMDGLRQEGRSDTASISVHVRAMRLLAPGSPPLPAEHQELVLAELAKILSHHGYSRASDLADGADVAA